MGIGPKSGLKGRLAVGIAAAAVAIAVPSAGYAVGLIGGGDAISAMTRSSAFASFTPASADPRIAAIVAQRTGGKSRMMRFTPAGIDAAPRRALTVAIRVDEQSARAISVRSAIDAAKSQVAAGGPVAIAPTRYNLGIAREIKSFAPAPAISRTLSDASIPDLSEFVPSPGVKKDPSRIAARIDFDEAAASRTGRDRDDAAERTIDAAASYRLTRNLNVTAGLRYEQDRSNRVSSLPDLSETDNQAVYVGTQFRF